MFLKLMSVAAAALSLNVAQAATLDSVKMFDGQAVQCLNQKDLGKVGYIFNNVQVSEQHEGDFVLSMTLSDVVCQKVGERIKWANLEKSPYGTQRLVAMDGNEYDVTNNSEVLAYTKEYKAFSTEINAQNLDNKNVAIDVRLVDVLSSTEKESLNRSGEVVVPVYLAKRSSIEFKNLQGRVVSQNYFVGGAFKVEVSVQKKDGRVAVSVK